MKPEQADTQESEISEIARRRIAILAIVGGMIFGSSYLLYVIYWSWKNDTWMTEVIKTHFAATVGAPLSAFASLLLVLLLRYAVGPIEIKGLGFEFKGAAGPVVLWIFCFLAMVSGIKMLWSA